MIIGFGDFSFGKKQLSPIQVSKIKQKSDGLEGRETNSRLLPSTGVVREPRGWRVCMFFDSPGELNAHMEMNGGCEPHPGSRGIRRLANHQTTLSPEHMNSGQLRSSIHEIFHFVRYVHGTQNAFLG